MEAAQRDLVEVREELRVAQLEGARADTGTEEVSAYQDNQLDVPITR